MKNLKLRVWDQKRNTFKLVKNVALYFGYQGDLLEPSDDEDLIFQQFTGLLDINNKEIFEGDIIRINFVNKSIGQVVYNLCSFIIVNKYGAAFQDTYYCLTNGKIIGNICENPKLLK